MVLGLAVKEERFRSQPRVRKERPPAKVATRMGGANLLGVLHSLGLLAFWGGKAPGSGVASLVWYLL